MSDQQGTAQVIKQRWWKRGGFWLALCVSLPAANGLFLLDLPSWLRMVNAALLLSGLLFAAVGWRQRVIVDEDGLHIRRHVRDHHVPWTEVERITDTDMPQLLLTNGITVPLFDWLGDGDRILAELREAEAMYRPPAPQA